MASSSKEAFTSHPSSDPCWKYDVFLSFRGPDTRKGITVDIYDGLTRRGIRTFMDDPDLQVGDAISPTLLAAIKESRFAIVVLSQSYASSTWCLEELREICLSMEDNKILPLFYHVEPTDVRYQKRSFEEAFSNHETSGRHESEKVKQWRDALNKVAKISGWNTQQYITHKELVNVIVEFVCTKVVPDAIESTEDFEVFKATRQAMDEVNEALKVNDVTAIGVYGMGGVGKTTLVEHVGAQTRTIGIFDYVTKCVVSQNPDLKNLQDTLAEQLSIRLDENTEIARAARLRKEIKRREKILLILDDIWEKLDLSRIGIPTYKELQKCNSKVLLTTRRLHVCHQMECQRKIALNVLSKQDSWALFVRKARRSFESATFEDVAKKVAKECKGLPIALITVARALGDKDLAEWKRAAQRLMTSQTANLDDTGKVYKCIKFSYDYLKDEECKSYFLLCCLFPEDDEIEMEDLFRYAIGKGLFQDADTLQEARERAESVARHLQYSCLLLEGRDGRRFLRMHDVVRDAAIQIGQSEEGFLVKAGCGLEDWPRQLHEGYSAISLMSNGIKKLPEKLVCPKLQILSLNSNPIKEIPEAFFQSPNELRVLDLALKRVLDLGSTYVGGANISSLPQSFSLLTKLQALYLDKCKITDTSVLGKLRRLEILSMRGTKLKELSIEVGGLTNLRIFDNTYGGIERIPPGVISKLHSLEELYIKGFAGWGRKVEGEGEETNACFGEVTTLSKLRVLKVTILDVGSIPKYVKFIPNWVVLDITIGREHDWRAYIGYDSDIFLELDRISRLPNWFGSLQRLKYLDITGSPRQSITEVDLPIKWVPKAPVFENLEELHLAELDGAVLCAIQFLPSGSLFNLKVLTVAGCYNWGNILLPSTLLQRLLNLEDLHFEKTDGGNYMFGYEALLVLRQLKLKKIDLVYLDTARICEGPAPPTMFQDLQSLYITCCKFQGSLFSYDVAQCLPQLNSLSIDRCSLLERIVEASNKKTILPKLKQLRLTDLPMFCSATFDIECPSLEHFLSYGCPKFAASCSIRRCWKLHPFNRFMDNCNGNPSQGGEPAMKAKDWRGRLHADSRQRIFNKMMETLMRHVSFSGQEGLAELQEIAVRFEEKVYATATSQLDYLRKISVKMLTVETKYQNTMANSLQSNAAGSSVMQPQVNNQGQFLSIENVQSNFPPAGFQFSAPNQGQSLSRPRPANQSQARQHLLSQNIQNNIPPAGVQSSAGLSSALPPASGLTQTHIPSMVGQNANLQSMSGTSQNSLGNSMCQGVASNMSANSQRPMPGRQQVVPQQQQQRPQNSQQYMYQSQQQLMKPNFKP